MATQVVDASLRENLWRVLPVSGWLGWWSLFFFSSRRRHTRLQGDWSSDVCSSDLLFVNDWANKSYPVHGAGRIWKIAFASKSNEPAAPPVDAARQRAAQLRES